MELDQIDRLYRYNGAMELRQVEHFVAVAGEMSFTRGAERAHVVQSALSTSVAKLEREHGISLFDRSRQQIPWIIIGHSRIRIVDLVRPAGCRPRSRDFHREYPFVQLRLRLSQSGASGYLAHAGRLISATSPVTTWWGFRPSSDSVN